MGIPRWLSTNKAIIHPNRLDLKKMVSYEELLDSQGKLKSNQELKENGIITDWWPYLQIQNKYEKDFKDFKDFGFDKGQNQLDKILMGPEQKLTTKIYKYLSKWKRKQSKAQ
uniref:Uncharacterized protein n=1 Tax=Micrurus lemniscatus lemniscatus TaxID=129467 RepID=A0A2D4IHH7_MICLE